MGRPRKPAHLHLVQGTARADRHDLDAMPKPKACRVPPPPEFLDGDALRIWARLAPIVDAMGIFTTADADSFERLCEAYADLQALKLDIQEHGRVYETQSGAGGRMIRARPEVAMYADADRRFRGYLTDFGLSPAARTRVKVADAPQENDPAAAYFAG
jgi:P27 family predicted phage terminase small subunit